MMYELAHCLISCIILITSFLTEQAEKDAESISNAKAMLEDRNYVKVYQLQHQPLLSAGGYFNLLHPNHRNGLQHLRDGTAPPSR